MPATSGRTTDDLDPVTGQVYVKVAAADSSDARRAVDAAHTAFPGWAATSPPGRRVLLNRAAELLEERADEFVEIMIRETAGTRGWAKVNIRLSAMLFREAATTATWRTGEAAARDVDGVWSLAVREPAGVVAAFVPWSGPLFLCARSVALPLAVGNTVVIRPSEQAPVTAGLFLADVLAEAGFPAGVVNVVTNNWIDAREVAEALITDPRVRRVSFTGSAPSGRIIARVAGEHLKRVMLALGGKNPILVLDDADVDLAAEQVARARFMNSGQLCLSVDRIIVDRSVAARFTERFLAHVATYGEGDPASLDTLVGPLIHAQAADRVAGLVADAVAKGAQVLYGGGRARGSRYPATVLTGITADMRIHSEEILGPVATIYTVDSESEAVALANDTERVLSSAVYTGNEARGVAVARRLRHSCVDINSHSVTEELPALIGGIHAGGCGHLTGAHDTEFFTESRWIRLIA
ncbi:aldehyde dehydrogenase family protein [Micromonospora sp. NPDC023737]|uniref:aldehyde dehydrogenase family protein n=1 Tax=unclassified Micromonospora TaxID=2617518 RepID=UPI00340836CC